MGQRFIPISKIFSPNHPHRIDIVLILFLGSTVFYYLSLLSFHPFDRSWFSVRMPLSPPQNAGGLFGSYLSSFFIYYLGLAAFVLPIPAFLFVFLRLFAKRRIRVFSFSLGGATFLFCASFVFSKLVPFVLFYQLPFSGGGLIGERIATSSESLLGRQGSFIVVTTLASLSLCLMLKRSIFYQKLACALHQGLVPLTSYCRRSMRFLGKICFFMLSPLKAVFSVPFARKPSRALSPRTGEFIANEPLVDVPYGKVSETLFTPLTVGTQPDLSIIFQPSYPQKALDESALHRTQDDLLNALADFKVEGEVLDYQQGPLVTTYAFKANKGIKQATIVNLMNDLALALKVESLFIHPIPEKSAIGFQIPNHQREVVRFADFVHSDVLHDSKATLPLVLGKNIYGSVICDDLTEMPHLLIAGSTGSGKSVGIHSFICSLLIKTPPAKLRLVLIDPKMLELTFYEGLPQLLMPVITAPEKALEALEGLIAEMEKRYRIMQAAKVRHIEDFNVFWQAASDEERAVLKRASGFKEISFLPYLVIVIDELADLMMTAAKEIENMIARLAQKARASGIHMILATQRPSVDVITGTIKANLPSRISYRLVSSHDSRTIIDQIGAEKLLGKGDLLFQKPGVTRLIRLHGSFIDDEEIKGLVAKLKKDALSSAQTVF